jgi:Mycothiol maleylpyruvate isomerase N-terminal domain
MRDAFLIAADSVVDLLSIPEVAQQWAKSSALAEWTVGGLAGHLASQLPTTVRVLSTTYAGEDLIPIHEHYHRAAWVNSAIDDEVSVTIRAGGDELAANGPDALVEATRVALDELRATLSHQSADRLVVIPWQGWALTLDDFLVTRMMEIVVHSDDLAASLGIEATPLESEALTPVLALLTDLAVRRHGQSAVVRALTRRERAPASIAAF